MQSDLYHCEVCSALYDKTVHIPKVIPICGHTLCSACLDKILLDTKKCPLDTKDFPNEINSINDFTSNLLVFQLIDKKLHGEYGTCNKHNQPKNMACVVDCERICEECALEHKDHTIKTVEELLKEAKSKKKRLEDLLIEFDMYQDQISFLLKDSKKAILTNLANEFTKINEMIKEKEKAAVLEIESWFEDKETELSKSIEKDAHLKKKCEVKIFDLDNQINIRFFNTLESLKKPFPSFRIKTELNELTESLEVVKKQCASNLETLNYSLASLINKTRFITNEIDSSTSRAETNNTSETAKDDELADLRHLLKIHLEEDSVEVSPITKPTNQEQADFTNLNLIREKKQIHIKFNKSDITKKHFEALNDVFPYCVNMSELHLYFNNREFTSRALGWFCHINTWAIERIEAFYLDCEHSQVSDKSIITLIENLLAKMTKIKCISLCLDHTKISDRSIFALISNVIKKAPTLSKFSLDVNYTNITDASTTELFKQLKPVSNNIKTFRLGLNMTEVSDQTLQAFASMDNLERLEVFLFKTKITDKGLRNFCRIARKSFEKTKLFCLDLGNTQLTYQSISTLGKEVLSSMPLIEEINIYLSYTKITDLGFKMLFENLGKNAQALHGLNLNFTWTKLTDLSFSCFAEEIARLKSLKIFSVDISNTKITDTSIQTLCERLKPIFKNFEVFELCVYGTEITKTGLNMLFGLVDLTLPTILNTFHIRLSDSLMTTETKQKFSIIQKHLSLQQK